MLRLKLFFLSVFSLFFLLYCVPTVQAQEASSSSLLEELPIPSSPLNLSLSPPSVFLETKPGQSVETTIKVFNNNQETEQLAVTLMKFRADPNGSQPILEDFTEVDDFQKWLSISPSTFNLDPQKWKTLQVSFSPPEDAGLSYYYAVLISRAQSQKAGEGESVVVGAPAILFLTKVKTPYEKQELQLLSFSSSQKVYEYLPTEFSVEIKNTGNIHLAPVGNIFIDDHTEKDVGLIELNRTLGVVLPNSTRTYKLKWNDGFPHFESETVDGAEVKDEKGNSKQKLKWDFSQANKFRFGKYTAHLVFIYDDGQRDVPTEATLSFWVIPWKLLLIIGGVSLLAITGLVAPFILLFRRAKKK